MSNSHKSSLLPLGGVSSPIDEHTRALFHYNWHAISHDGKIRPLGAYPDEEGCVLYYDFSKEQDVALDLSGNDNHGTMNNITWESGRNGKSLRFDGNGFVRVETTSGDSLDLRNQLSFSVWLFPHQLNSNISSSGSYIISKNISGGFSEQQFCLVLASSTVQVWINNISLSHSYTTPLNQWTHFSATWDGSIISLFINGVFVASAPCETTAVHRPFFFIGARSANNNGSASELAFKGLIDKVAVYNRALSPEEIQAHYNESIYTIRPDGKYGGAIAIERATENILSRQSGNTPFEIEGNHGAHRSIQWQINQPVQAGEEYILTGDFWRNSLHDGRVYAMFSLVDSAGIQIPGNSGLVPGWGATESEALYIYFDRNIKDKANNQWYEFSCPTIKIPEGYSGGKIRWIRFSIATNPTDSSLVTKIRNARFEKITPGQSCTSFVGGAREDGKLIYPVNLFTNEYTISLWFKRHNSNLTGQLLQLEKDDSNVFWWDLKANNVSSLSFIQPNGETARIDYIGPANWTLDWSMVTLVWDGKKHRLYHNGKLVETSNNTTLETSSYDLLYLGHHRNGVQPPTNILIDELRIDNVARTEEEIYSWWVSDSPFYPSDKIKIVG